MSSVFTEKQIKIIKYNNIYKPIITILEGAVRSGKTYIDNWLWLSHIHQFKNHRKKFIMTGHTIPSLVRNVIDEISAMLNINITLNQKNEFSLLGNKIACFGTDNINSYKAMKGFTAYGWYGNEIVESHKNSIDQARKRCSGEGARIFWDTNPSFPTHFIKTDFIDKDGEKLSNGKIHIKSWHFKLEDNNFLSPTYVESLKKSTPSGMWYDRDILGLWVAAEGMIYKDFDYSEHVIDVKPVMKEYFCGVDWGYDHYGVIALYGRDGDGKIVRLREIAETEKGLDWWTKEAKLITDEYGRIPFYCDPARPDNIDAFRRAKINAKEANNAVVEGITFIAEKFKKKQLFIFRDSNKHYLQEIYNYRWRENVRKEEPIKENDDSMDSERYAIYSHCAKPLFIFKRHEGKSN